MENNHTYTDTITITFGDCAGTYVGKKEIGVFADEGYTLDDLKKYKTFYIILISMVFHKIEFKGINFYK